MIFNSLEYQSLYKELNSRKDPAARTLAGLILPVFGDSQELLEFVKIRFPGHTSHGIQHSLRIIERVGKILGKRIKNLSSVEIFIFIFASLFHDIGMIDDKDLDQNSVRSEHHHRSAVAIQKYFDERLQIIKEHSSRLAKIAMFVAEGHGLSQDLLRANPYFYRTETILGEDVRCDVLCMLLRIGDLLDLDADRVCPAIEAISLKFIEDPLSIIHHMRHKTITGFRYSSEYLTVKVQVMSRIEHQIWALWLSWLDADIQFANTYVFKGKSDCFRLPGPDLDVEKHPDAKYELLGLRFELDDAGRLWEVVSKSVYTTRLAFVRELILNAIDATLVLIYEDSNIKNLTTSPRGWFSQGKQPTIAIAYGERWLTVIDNGIGMDANTLQRFLFRVASTGHNSLERRRNFDFPSIAEFGIGFISTLTRAERIDIYTQSFNHKASPVSVHLTSGSRDAFVENADSRSHGTTIRLCLNFDLRPREVTDYIENNLPLTSLPVKIIDARSLEKFIYRSEMLNANTVQLKNALENIAKGNPTNNELCLLQDSYDEVEKSVRSIQREVNNRIIKLSKSIDDLSNNRDNVRSSRVTDEYSRSEIVKELEKMDRDLMQFSKDRKKQTDLNNKLSELLELGQEGIRQAGCKELECEVINDPFICRFSEDSVSSFAIEIRPSLGDFDSGSCVLWIPIRILDYDHGLEWQSIHGFLCCKDELARSVVAWAKEEYGKYIYMEAAEFEEIECAFENSRRREEAIFEEAGFDYDGYYNELSAESYNLFTSEGKLLIAKRKGIKDISDYFDSWVKNFQSEYKYYEKNPELIPDDPIQFRYKFMRAYRNLDGSFYQDGIRLPLNANAIAPIGVCRTKVNLTSDCRLRLNVTREDVDRSHGQLAEWVRRVALPLNSKIHDRSKEVLTSLGFDYSEKADENKLLKTIEAKL